MQILMIYIILSTFKFITKIKQLINFYYGMEEFCNVELGKYTLETLVLFLFRYIPG